MVNSYTRAQTEGIDLICSIRPADGSALLILDSAGYDLDVAPRDSNFLSALCLILADATVLFVGGQLLEDDISRLASFVALTDQALLTDGLPHHVERRPGGDLTVLYSPVASGRPIDASVDGTQYTRGRFSVASGVRSAGRQIIQDNFGVGGIRGLSIPHVEEALSPEGGNPDGSILAKKVLARPGVRERLSGVTTFLLASPTLHRPPRSGTMVVETLRNAFALLSSPQVLSLLDTPSSDANNLVIACIVKLVSRERSSIVKFLATSEQRTVTADTTV